MCPDACAEDECGATQRNQTSIRFCFDATTTDSGGGATPGEPKCDAIQLLNGATEVTLTVKACGRAIVGLFATLDEALTPSARGIRMYEFQVWSCCCACV